jgi:hypothetical protein
MITYTEEKIEAPESYFLAVKKICENAIDNAHELLVTHLDSLGETTHKNKYIANMYRQEIDKTNQILALTKQLLGCAE